MDTHKNAPMTPAGRLRMVQAVLGGETISSVAQRCRIDPKSVRKWLLRYRAQGEAGLRDRSSRPHQSPKAIARGTAQRVITLRQRRWTMSSIAAELRISTLGVRVRCIMTDNAKVFRSLPFIAACRHWRVRHIFTKIYTPRTNGKAERFIQTALREWAYGRPYRHSRERTAYLPDWLHRYNWHRPHSSLAGHAPISRLRFGADNLLRLHT